MVCITPFEVKFSPQLVQIWNAIWSALDSKCGLHWWIYGNDLRKFSETSPVLGSRNMEKELSPMLTATETWCILTPFFCVIKTTHIAWTSLYRLVAKLHSKRVWFTIGLCGKITVFHKWSIRRFINLIEVKFELVPKQRYLCNISGFGPIVFLFLSSYSFPAMEGQSPHLLMKLKQYHVFYLLFLLMIWSFV